MGFAAADDRYEQMTYRRCGPQRPQAAGDLARPLAELRRRAPARDAAARSSAARSTSASPTSTSRTTTARRTARPRRTFGEALRRRPRAVPRRARDLDEGGLRHVAGPVRRVGLAQVPAREPRPEPRAGWGSTTSTSSTRTASIPRRRSRRRWARSRPPSRQGKALYAGISSYSAEQTREAARDPARARRAAPDPPAVVLDAQPLDRGRPARRARRARASAASPSRRSPRACSPTSTWTGSPRARARAGPASLSPEQLNERDDGQGARAERDRRGGAARRSRSSRSPGRSAIRG